jgi:hypothetical protein
VGVRLGRRQSHYLVSMVAEYVIS